MRHHGAGLHQLTKNDKLVAALVADYQQAEISAADRAMLAYAVKLTRAPAAIAPADVEALRHVGFSDAAVLDICQITAYYAFVNRLADGLGVELEDYWNEQQV
jgi:uncharacterized peroxidase-related enzyme